MTSIAIIGASPPFQSSSSRPAANSAPAAEPEEDIYVDQPIEDNAGSVDDGTYDASAGMDTEPSGTSDDVVYVDEPLAGDDAATSEADESAPSDAMSGEADAPEVYEDEPLWDAGAEDDDAWMAEETQGEAAVSEPEVYEDEPPDDPNATREGTASMQSPVATYGAAPAAAALENRGETTLSSHLQGMLERPSSAVDLELSEDRRRESALDALEKRMPTHFVAGAGLATGTLLLVGVEHTTKPAAATLDHVASAYREY